MPMNWKYTSILTNEDIKNVENKLNIIYPESYKEFIKYNNGGKPDKNRFTCEGDNSERIINYLIDLSDKNNYSVVNLKDALPHKLVPFADDPFGNVICFSSDENYKIVFYHHETEEIVFVCNNFEEFLSKLS